jgi:3-hydroxybutyryl-CoA dehydratase
MITKEIDQERILKWAELSGDFNSLHVDPQYAKKTPFKGTIAHGPMSLAFLNELMMQWAGERWPAGGRLLDVRFRAPIRPGERIRVTGTVKGRLRVEGKTWVECELFIEKPDGVRAVEGRARVPEEE